MRRAAQVRFDVLAWRPVRGLMRWSGFPVLLQAVACVAVLWIATVGLGVGAGMSGEDLMTLRKTNLTTLVVWGLWWPGMILVALLLGRAWCTVCPMELLNRIGEAVRRRVGWRGLRLGGFLRAGWMTVALYLVLQILVAGMSLHRVPHHTAVMVLALAGGALATGVVFREPRSFCRAFCPASALLSVYGRYTPVQLEVREPAVCDRCATKDCTRPENRDRFDRRSCPSLLRPYRRDPSDGCVVCLQCAKVCPHGNVGLGLVAEGSPARTRGVLRPFEAAFVMIALGFVAHEVIGEVKWLDAFFHAVPERLNALAPHVSFGWFEALWFLVLFPLVVWGAIGLVAYVAGYRRDLALLFLAAATGAAPVVAVAHLAKAAAKMASWSGYLPLALRDPEGIETFRRIADRVIQAPGSLVGLTVVGWAMLVLTLLVAWKAWRWVRDVPPESVRAARVGLVATAVLFAGVLTVWAWPAR